MASSPPIAVVGAAGRFPGASDLSAYWQNILADVCSIAPMPASRFHHKRYFDPEVGAYGKSYCDLGGLVDDPNFDSVAFRIPPKQLEQTDVAHLHALEVARATLEDAGYDPFDLRGSNVGVIVGHARGSMMSADMAFATAVEGMVQALEDSPRLAALGLDGLAAIQHQVIERIHKRYGHRTESGAAGAMVSAAAGLLTSAFGFTGRHAVVDAACASSFAALDMGVRALSEGRLDAALVGGASHSQELSVVMFAQSRALSADGSFPFDVRANGFISSDGYGLVLLRRLEDALRDGNRIRAVIRAVGGSCDGKGRALWAPRKEGQVLAMQRAYQRCDVDPATIALIEGHATSTALGDRTEIEALHDVYGEHGGMRVGSVKGNIGHAREAAGVAGLLKGVMALEQGILPPTGNFRTPNPEIPWNDVAVKVQTEAEPWPETNGPRRMGCNAFGIGGLNYHVVVEQAPEGKAKANKPRLEATSAPIGDCDIAIVGIGLRMPGAFEVGKFWQDLLEARDVTQDVPAHRWRSDLYFKPGERSPFRTYLKRGAFVEGFEANWRRYKVPPKLVERNDPLQFMVLESALDALDGGGIDLDTVDRERVGVMVGSVFGSDFALDLSLAIRSQELAEDVADAAGDPTLYDEVLAALRGRLPSINEDSSGSFSSSTLASRTAKTLNLNGPTFAMDAACASSFAAVEAGIEMLRAGTVDLALVGGGDRAMRVQRYEAYCQFYAVTQSGIPRPFDAGADGFLPGEGAAVVVLERLEDAKKNNRNIIAVVRGIGSSSDGERKSLYKPSEHGLGRAIERAQQQADVPKSDVGFVECHGGATELGDLTEINALRRGYETESRTEALRIGSLKSNVGHTQGTAGVAGLIKAALTLQHDTVVPTRGLENPNPAMASDLRATKVQEPLNSRAVAASSLGLAGIDYHAILSRHVEDESKVSDTKAPYVIRVAALDGESLQAHLTSRVTSKEIAVVSAKATASFVYETEEDIDRIGALVEKTGLGDNTRDLREKQGLFVHTRAPSGGDRIAFCFSGQGSQYPHMMSGFINNLPEAKAILDRVDGWMRPLGLGTMSQRIAAGDDFMGDVFGVQAAVLTGDLMAHAALVKAGIEPDIVTGHSYGDYAALVAAESITLEEALMLTRARAESVVRARVEGGMASISAPAADVQSVLSSIDNVWVANINAPDQTVIAGSTAGLDKAEAAAAAAGYTTQRLVVPGPFHSQLMEPARATLADALSATAFKTPRIPFLSSVTRRFEDDPNAIRAALEAQLLEPVDWVAQMERLYNDGLRVFIECGPKAVLTSLTRRTLGRRDAVVVPADDKDRGGAWSVARVAAALDARARVEGARTPMAMPTSRGAESHISVLDGAEADRLWAEDGFAEFWDRTRPSLYGLLSSLWEAEKRASRLPGAASEAMYSAPGPGAVKPKTPSPAVQPPVHRPPSNGHVVARSTIPVAKPAVKAPVASPPPAAAPATSPVASTPKPSGPKKAVPIAEVREFLLQAMCDESGYPPELLEFDADLEADLGIDTVKQAQVLGKMRDKYDLHTDEKLSLRDFPTLQHVLEYVTAQLQNQSEEAPRARRIAVVDVTERRSTPPSKPAPVVKDSPSNGHGVRPPSSSRQPHRQASSSAPEAPKPDDPLPAPGPDSLYEIPPPEVRQDPKRPQPVTTLHLSGTPREMGEQHGEAMRDPIRGVMEAYQAFIGGSGMEQLALPETLAFLRRFFDAPSLEEIGGLARGVGMPEPYLLAYNLDAALFPVLSPGCTQSLRRAADNDGVQLHAINEDSPLLLHLGGLHPRVVQFRRATNTPNQVVFFSLAGQLSGPNGVRDDGLTITSTTLLNGREGEALELVRGGAPHPQLVKQLLETAHDASDARQRILQSERSGRWSVLLSDAERDTGHYLEYDGPEVLTDHAVDAPFCSTNHALQREAEAPEHSLLRQRRAKELFDAQPTTAEDMQAGLRDLYDHGRGRAVKFPTMNTVRRADNVMSLVVEPTQRLFWVTDRVIPPGCDEQAEFIAMRYGDAPVRSHAQLVEQSKDTDASKDVMRRFVVRPLVESGPTAVRTVAPLRLRLFGEGPIADAVAAQFAARGTTVDRSGATRSEHDAVGFVLSHSNAVPWRDNEAQWTERRETNLDTPFAVLRDWVPGRQGGLLFAVTQGGGGFGFANAGQGAPEQLGLVGALKGVRREFDGFQVQVIDTNPSEAPDNVAQALLTELDAGSPRLEVGLLRGRRLRLTMSEQPAEPATTGQPLPRTWIVTGGARGITAKMALRLAKTSGPRLWLLGRTPLPPEAEQERLLSLSADGIEAEKKGYLQSMKQEPGFTPKAWRARCDQLDKHLEMLENLRDIQQAGSEVRYRAVDLADRHGLEVVVKEATAFGPVQGLLHGAGVEVAKPLEKKSDELYQSTIGGKLNGLINLLALTEEQPLTHVVGFSSVSGRFGGHGQVDYALANEALVGVLCAYRAAHPGRCVSSMAWAAFSEVGLAARSSAKAFLEQSGQAFMTPAEGAQHLLRELWAGAPETGVTICERMEVIDLDHLLVPEPERASWKNEAAHITQRPLLDQLVHCNGRTVIERRLNADEPFLDQHRMGPVAIMPAVVALEMMAEAAGGALCLKDVEIVQPLKVRDPIGVYAEKSNERLRIFAPVERSGGITLDVERTFVRAKLGDTAAPSSLGALIPVQDGVSYPYPDGPDTSAGSRMIFHGPVFRGVEEVVATTDGGVARLLALDPEALVDQPGKTAFTLPVPLLDACLQAAGLLGRLAFQVTALPAGFGSMVAAPRAAALKNREVQYGLRWRPRDGDVLHCDIWVIDEEGPVLTIMDYQARVLPQ